MPNRRRGEVALHLDGTPHTLCLTLGALAELEEAFAAADLAGLAERLAGRLSARDVLLLLGAALRGGGHALTDAEVARLSPDGGLDAAVDALADALALAFGAGAPPNPPPPQA